MSQLEISHVLNGTTPENSRQKNRTVVERWIISVQTSHKKVCPNLTLFPLNWPSGRTHSQKKDFLVHNEGKTNSKVEFTSLPFHEIFLDFLLCQLGKYFRKIIHTDYMYSLKKIFNPIFGLSVYLMKFLVVCSRFDCKKVWLVLVHPSQLWKKANSSFKLWCKHFTLPFPVVVQVIGRPRKLHILMYSAWKCLHSTPQYLGRIG